MTVIDVRSIFLVACVSTCGCATAPSTELDVAQDVVVDEWGPDLAPMAPDWSQDWYRNYAALVRRVLLPEDEPRLWMICRPSFDRESAVALEPVLGELDVEGYPFAPPRTWTLTVTSAWIGRVERGAVRSDFDWTHANRTDFPISTASVEIDARSAGDIYEAWKLITRRARQPEPEYVFDPDGQRVEVTRVIFDGVRYEFGCAGHYGEAHSPDSGPAQDLAALALRLRAIPALDGAEREVALAACAEDARRLKERAEALPW